MSEPSTPSYEFSEGIPLERIQLGTTVMVTGESFGPAESLARTLVTDGSAHDEGMLFVSTTMTAKKFLAACERTRPSLQTPLLGIVDCSGQNVTVDDSAVRVESVSTQSDLTGIGMKFSALYQSAYEDSIGGRVRTGLVTLSSLLMYVDLRRLYRFTQTLSARIESADGLGVLSLDPTTHDPQSVNTLKHVADGQIEVRESEGGADGELRVRGLPGQPEGWQPFWLSS